MRNARTTLRNRLRAMFGGGGAATGQRSTSPIATADPLEHVAETWERLAQIDPLWAVLSEPDKIGRRWDRDDFLNTGKIEIDALIGDLVAWGLDRFDEALDFGCGVGRLTIPLAGHFTRVTGVDISPTMVATARSLAGDGTNARFVVNDRPDLAFVSDASVDLVYSNIVLQHMDPFLARGYINEFLRIVRDNGFVVFQIPSHLREEWLPNGNHGTQLPDGAHRARLDVIDAPVQLAAGQEATVKVRVTNESGVDWEQDLLNQINLANHWVADDAARSVHDDGRVRLPGRMRHNESHEIELTVRAPRQPGQFVLELDIVQENIAWFAQLGSPVARHEIDVVALAGEGDAPVPGPTTDADTVEPYPVFMMRGIPRPEIESLVSSAGGEILEATSHVTEWMSYRYVVRRLPRTH